MKPAASTTWATKSSLHFLTTACASWAPFFFPPGHIVQVPQPFLLHSANLRRITLEDPRRFSQHFFLRTALTFTADTPTGNQLHAPFKNGVWGRGPSLSRFQININIWYSGSLWSLLFSHNSIQPHPSLHLIQPLCKR